MEFDIKTLAACGSTQDEAKKQAGDPPRHGFVVHTLQQDTGRGRQGNSWHGPMGNLYMSVVLNPSLEAKHSGQLAFVAALTVAGTVRALTDGKADISLKWPNDVLVDGKKIAGILIEKEGDAYILGIGLNILAPPEDAIGLQEICDKRTPINPVRDFLLDVLDGYYTRWLKEGFEPIREQWMRKAAFMDQEIQVNLADGKDKGVFKGIDENGALILEKDGEIKKILSGEVFASS